MADGGMGLAGMGGAAGAGDAIAQVFQQRLEAAAAQRQQQALEQTDALTRLKLAEHADEIRQRIEGQKQAEHDRAEAAKAANDARLNAQASQLPTDLPVPGSNPIVQAVPGRFNPTPITAPAPPTSLAAPDQSPEPQPMVGTVANAPAPAQRMFSRIPTPQEQAGKKLLDLYPIGSRERALAEYEIGTGKNAPASFMAAPKGTVHDTAKGLVRIGDDNSITPLGVQGFHQAPQPVVIQTGNGPQLLNRGAGTTTPITEGGSGETVTAPTTAQTKTRADNAKNVLAHISDVEQEAEQINKLGLMGPVGGRWADFMAGKVGAGELAAGDPKAAELLGQFRADVGLLKSGMAMVHGGARGGGSPAIIARMDALLNADKMDLPLFKGATSSFRKWLETYAGSTGGEKKPSAEELIKKYGGTP